MDFDGVFKNLLAGSLAAVTCGLASADTVVLDNGDRLTGDIQEMTRHRLVIETHYTPEIEIEWQAVRTVESDRLFAVWLEDGERLVGTLEAVDGGGFLVTGGEDPVAVAPDALVRLYPVADEDSGFSERLEMDLEVGFAVSRGNAILNQSYLGLDTRYRRDGYEIQWDTASLVTKQSEDDDISRQTTKLQADVFLSDRWFSFLVGGLERDVNQRLGLRTNVGGGLGWHVLRKDDLELAVLAGSTWSIERFRDAPGAVSRVERSFLEGLFGFELFTDKLGGVELTSKATLLPTLNSTGRYRMTFDSNIRVPLTRRFHWGILLYDRFDSQPQPGVARNDIGIFGTLGVSF